MRLINDFFDILETDSVDGTLRCKIRLNADHKIYGAHFPGNPVTPGVCLVQMASEILDQHYSKRFMLNTLINIKFKKAVSPADEPTFVFTKGSFAEQQYKCLVSVEDENAQFVKMSMLFDVTD